MSLRCSARLSLLANAVAWSPPAMIEGMRHLGDEFLRELLAEQLDRLRRNSEPEMDTFWHPNGFAKIILATASSGEQARVHYWAGGAGDDGDLHNHRWPYSSWVVRGRFVQTIYEASASGEMIFAHYTWADGCVGGPRDGSSVKVALGEVSREVLAHGATYSLREGVVHRFSPMEAGLTVAIQGAAMRDRSDIFVPLDSPTGRERKPIRMSAEQAASVVREILGVLSDAPHDP